MRSIKRTRAAVLLAGAMLAVGASPALAKELTVAKPGDTSCGANSSFPTIQSAVDAASSGDHIKVCPGTYQEHVVIPAGKDDLDLQGKSVDNTFIQFPPALPASGNADAVVLIDGATGITLHHFTVEGPWSDAEAQGCGQPTHYGIFVEGGGSASIQENRITFIQDAAQAGLGGCQDGLAVRVGSNFLGQTGSGRIKNNEIDNYQKNGVTIDGPGTSAEVDNNAIIGDSVDPNGINPLIARNGIQIGRGTQAFAHNNFIQNNEFVGGVEDPDGNDAAGILAFEVTGGVEVSNNTLTANDIGFDLGFGPPGSEEAGFGPTSGVLTRNNFATSNRFDGFRAEQDAQQNTFANDQASGTSAGHDCRDDSTGTGTAGTANSWKNDQGNTSLPIGICRPKH